MRDAWAGEGPGPGLAVALVRRLGGPARRIGLDPGRWSHLLAARLVMARRGGPFGTIGPGTRLARALLPGVFLCLGFLLAAPLSTHPPEPWQWMATVQTSVWLLMAQPLYAAVGILLDQSDQDVLGHLPLSARQLLAARMAHMLASMAPPAVAVMVGPLVLGPLRYPPVAVLAGLPLATGLTLVTMVAGYCIVHALLMRLCGREGLGRLALAAQVLLGASLLGGGALAVATLAPVLVAGMGALLASPGGASFAIPPIQLGGAFELLCGDLSPRSWGLAGLALLTPLVATVTVLALAPSARSQAALARERKSMRSAWPGGPLAGLAARSTPAGPERAGFGLSTALALRDPMIVRHYWQFTLGSLAMCVFLALTIAPSLGDRRDWAVMLFWFAMLFPWKAAESVLLSSHPGAAWGLQTVGRRSRERLFVGATRGAWVTLGLPTAAIVLVLPASLLRSTAVLADLLLMLEVSVLLTAWILTGLEHPTPFAWTRAPSLAGKPRSSASRPARRGLSVRLLVPPILLAHALLHARWWLVGGAALLLMPFVLRAWRSLAGLRLAAAETPASATRP